MVYTLSISSVESRILTLPILWSLTAPLPAAAAVPSWQLSNTASVSTVHGS